MAPDNQQPDTPREFPEVTPRDLYPTSDIRFVLVELGKLSTKVDRLILDGDSTSKKLDGLLNQAAFIKGAIAASTVFIGVVIWFASVLLNAKWDAALEALRAVSK